MIRNQKSGKLVLYNSPHYRKLLKQQEETGETFFLKKDIRTFDKDRVLQVHRFAKPRDDVEDCPICMEPCLPSQNCLRLMPCGHRICEKCIQTDCFNKLYVNRTCVCPICRIPLTGPPEIFVKKKTLRITVEVVKHKKVNNANEHLFEFNFVKDRVLRRVKGRINAVLHELGHNGPLVYWADGEIRYKDSDEPASDPNLKHWKKWTFVVTIPFKNDKDKRVITTMREVKHIASEHYNNEIVRFRESESNHIVNPDVKERGREPVLWMVKLIGYTIR